MTAHPEAASPYGVCEMAGNVWEWTLDLLEDGEPVHVVKGGCFNDPPDLLRSDMPPAGRAEGQVRDDRLPVREGRLIPPSRGPRRMV